MDAVDDVKSKLSIEDVIGEYVQLKRAGRNFRGLSPFNSEKTPSFMVSPEKQIWHDFSSNKGGNMFSFVMEMEGLDFKGALELLARKAGIDLEQYRQPGSGKSSGPNKARLLQALDFAAKFYQVQLSVNKEALTYVLSERCLNKDTVLLWRLGYSPNNGTALKDYLVKQGFSEQEIRQAGLISKRANNTTSDMFRGRLMIPLQDPQGQVIGFTARQLPGDDFGPKYINTPQTVLYDKSRHIFGLHLAKTSIREAKFVVISEGNLDVISSHQAGVGQVVATAGTALTEYHLKGLVSFAGDIRLCFDGDKAGIAATERAVAIASRLKLSLNIIDIAGGKDPDELIKKDPNLWLQAINKYTYAVDWLIAHQENQFDLKSAEGKRHFTDAILPIINNLDDAVEVDHYLNLIAKKINIKRQALEDKSFSKGIAKTEFKRRSRVEIKLDPKEQIEIAKVENRLLSLMLKQPKLRLQIKGLNEEILINKEPRILLRILKKDSTISEEQLNRLDSISDYVKIESLQYEELYQDLELSELKYEAARLQVRLIEYYVKQQKLNIAKQLVESDEKMTEVLLTQASQLDELLRINLGEQTNA
jgi:DNA primase